MMKKFIFFVVSGLSFLFTSPAFAGKFSEENFGETPEELARQHFIRQDMSASGGRGIVKALADLPEENLGWVVEQASTVAGGYGNCYAIIRLIKKVAAIPVGRRDWVMDIVSARLGSSCLDKALLVETLSGIETEKLGLTTACIDDPANQGMTAGELSAVIRSRFQARAQQ